jgi:hypothetical protein
LISKRKPGELVQLEDVRDAIRTDKKEFEKKVTALVYDLISCRELCVNSPTTKLREHNRLRAEFGTCEMSAFVKYVQFFVASLPSTLEIGP